MKNLLLSLAALSVGTALEVSGALCTYTGPNYGQPFSPTLSGGKLTLENDSRNIYGTFEVGTASIVSSSSLVFYLDTKPGGYSTTAGFTRSGDYFMNEVSGYNSTLVKRSTVNFAPGFQADYALVLSVGRKGAYLFTLDDNGGVQNGAKLNAIDYPSFPTSMDFTLPYSRISTQADQSIKFVSTHIAESARRYAESLESFSMPGGTGFNTLTFTDYHEFPVSAVPEPANVALALFGTAFGIVVAVRRIRNRRQ